ncbi:MAG: hypothetical protein ACYCZM_14410 [Acidimicrobiales bacterium]
MVADVRVTPAAIRDIVTVLEGYGFTLEGNGPDGVAHRYVRVAADPERTSNKVTLDVLAPEGMGTRSDLTTTKPGHTVQVPGGTQALKRTELVTVIHDGRHGTIPRPNLLAAVVVKAAALIDHAHPGWMLVPEAIWSQGQITYSVLSESR